MAEILNTLKITPWWIPSSKLLAHRGCAVSQCCCMHIEWPIMLLPKRSHLHSCRCISPGSETWDQSQPCQCYSLATVKAKSFASSLSTGCQSWGQQATQICLTVCHLPACFGIADTVFLEILYTARCAGTAALPSVAAASGCAQCLHSPGLSPPWCTCHCSMCGHLPPLALLLLILGSRANSKAPRAQCGLRACPAISLPWEPHSRPVWLLWRLWPVPGPAPVPSPLSHSAGAQFLWGFWASEGQFGKRQGGGSKQGLSSFPHTCQGLQLCVGFWQSASPCPQCILPGTFIWGQGSRSHDGMTGLGSGCFELGTEGCWDLLDGSTTWECPASPHHLSVSPGCRGGKTSMSAAMFGKKTKTIFSSSP